MVKKTLLDNEGRPHCDNGAAIFTYNPVTGQEMSRTYYQHGVITRDNGAAIEEIDLERLIYKLVWMKEGKKDRDGDAAEIKTDLVSGVEYSRAWYKNDLMHREQGYALMTFDRVTGELDGRFLVHHGKRQPFIEFPDASL